MYCQNAQSDHGGGDVRARGARVLRVPQRRVAANAGRTDLIAPEVEAGVDDRRHADRGLDVIDPDARPSRRPGGGVRPPSASTSITGGRSSGSSVPIFESRRSACAIGPGSGGRTGRRRAGCPPRGSAPSSVRTSDRSKPSPVGDADERVLDAVGFATRVQSIVALVVRDVDAFDRRAGAADGRGRWFEISSNVFGSLLPRARHQERAARGLRGSRYAREEHERGQRAIVARIASRSA